MDEPIDLSGINQNLGIELQQQASYEELRLKLAAEVGHLLLQDAHRVFAFLYRIDVREEHVKVAMNSDDPADYLADLILKKFIEKSYWRNKYKNRL